MKESYVEGLATHNDSESCAETGNRPGEALTGVRAGRVLSRERTLLQGADAVRRSGRLHRLHRQREMQRDPARSETPCTYGNTLRGTREIPCLPTADGVVGRVGKSKDVRRR